MSDQTPELRNAAEAHVAIDKIEKYLLALDHPDGGPKARFFLAQGFSLDEPERLAAALVDHAASARLLRERASEHGVGYDMIGELRCPNGNTVVVRSGWFIDAGESVPRLVTAFPG